MTEEKEKATPVAQGESLTDVEFFEDEKRVIETVYHLEDNTIKVYDQFGEEMPKYQGKYDDVIDKINEDKPEDVKILFGIL